MRSMRVFLILATVLLTLAAAGCGKTYMYDFAKEGSFIKGDEEWFNFVFPEGVVEFTPDGVYLDGSCISSPFEFSGDMTYTAKFLLNVDVDHMCNILICLTDAIGIEHDNGLHFSFTAVGNPGGENCRITDLNMPLAEVKIHLDEPGAIPGLLCDGENIFIMVKRGDHVRATINGTFLAEFDLEWYSSAWFNPAIMGDLVGDAAPGYGFTLTQISVQYNGDVKPLDM